jgi:AraC family transcriptional regulator
MAGTFEHLAGPQSLGGFFAAGADAPSDGGVAEIGEANLLLELSSTLERVHRIADFARKRESVSASAEVSATLGRAADLLTIAFSRFDACCSPATRSLAKGGLAGWQVRAVQKHIAQHLGDRILIADLAGVARISGSYLCRAFQATFGCSPGEYLRRERLAFAKTQLRSTQLGLSEIACSCGFADQPHFTRVFRAEVGMTPRTWRIASRDSADLPLQAHLV